jgi:hypothetical protein
LLPALLAVLLTVLPVLVAAPITTRLAREAVRASQEQMNEQRGMELSAQEEAQMEQAMSVAASPLITVVFPVVGAVVGRAVGWLAWAGALYLAGLALGGRSGFGKMFQMVVWTWLPYALRGLLQTVYILVTGEIIANPGLSGLVMDTSSVTEMVVTPPSTGQLIATSFLSRLDLFMVWNLVLLVIGVIVFTRLPRRKAVLVTLGVWLVLTALGLVPALVSGLFSQQVGGM